MSKSTRKKVMLKPLKEFNTIWHPLTGLVLKSKKERVIIGRFIDGNIVPLDETALELCEEWGMTPDETLLEEGEEEEEEEEGEDEDSLEKSDKTREKNDEDTKEEYMKESDQESGDEKVGLCNKQVLSAQDFSSLVENLIQHENMLRQQVKTEQQRIRDQENVISKIQDDFDELHEKYEVLEKKFGAIKSLFS